MQTSTSPAIGGASLDGLLVYTCAGIRENWATLSRTTPRDACSVDDGAGCALGWSAGHGLYCTHNYTAEQADSKDNSCDGLHCLILLCVKFNQSFANSDLRALYGDNMRALSLLCVPGWSDRNCTADFADSEVSRPNQTSSTLPFCPTATS